MAGGGELETGQRDMGAVEIDRDDLAGIGGEIGQDVAPARGDRDQPRTGPKRKRAEIDLRVLPDLRIDEAAKGERENPLENALARYRLRLMDRTLQSIGGGRRRRAHGQRSSSNWSSRIPSSANRSSLQFCDKPSEQRAERRTFRGSRLPTRYHSFSKSSGAGRR